MANSNGTVTVKYGDREVVIELDGMELSTDSAGGFYLGNASRDFVASEVETALISLTA